MIKLGSLLVSFWSSGDNNIHNLDGFVLPDFFVESMGQTEAAKALKLILEAGKSMHNLRWEPRN